MSEAADLHELLAGLRQDRERVGVRAREAGLCADRLVVRRGQLASVVPLDQLLYVEQKDERIHFHLVDGRIVTSNKSYTLDGVRRVLAAYLPVRRTHENYLANLAHLEAIGPAPHGQEGRLLHLGDRGVTVLLSDGYVPGVRKALGLQSLDHVIPWNERYAAIRREHIRDFDEPIATFDAERLRAEFRYPTIEKPDHRQLMANMLWQYHSWLSLPPSDPRKTWPIDGNIRTFWYYTKPAVGRLDSIDVAKRYDQLIEVLNSLVRARVFRYRDFGFVDEGENTRRLGPAKGFPHIVLVAEKAGHFRKLERLQEEFRFTFVALGGAPSLLSAEYFLDEIRDKVDLKATPLRLISLVDYDPAGAAIIASFRSQLASYGVKAHTLSHVLHPGRFTPEELANVVFEVPLKNQGDRTRAEKWITAGGGIDGKPLGIECEALVLDYGRLRGIVAELVEEAKRPPVALLGQGSDPLAELGLPPYFSAELLEEDEAGFWEMWAERVAREAPGAG